MVARAKVVKISSRRSVPSPSDGPDAEQLSLDIRSPRHQEASPVRARTPRKPVTARAPELDQILNSVDIERITGRHRCTVYRWMLEGRFPAKVVRDGRAIGWLRSEVERWLHAPSLEVPRTPLGASVSHPIVERLRSKLDPTRR